MAKSKITIKKLSKKQFEVLWAIEEGMNDIEGIEVFTSIEKKDIIPIINFLESKKLIKLINKSSKPYYLLAQTTQKAKDSYKKYPNWIKELTS